MTTGDLRRPPFWLAFLGSWVLLSLLSALWALATPIGAAPDEPAHLIKAASVVRGQFIGEPSAQGNIVQVPQVIAYTHAQTCFAFEPDVDAACMPEVPGDPDVLVDATTTAGLYNPLYYALVGWPSLLGGGEGMIYGMRVVSAVLASAFLALAFAALTRWSRPLLPLLALGIATTPMVLFLSGTVNPNPVETTAVLAAFVGMLTIVRRPGIIDPPMLALVAASAIVASNTRGLSLLWVFVALVVPLLALRRRELFGLLTRRPVVLTIVAVGVGAAAAAAWLLGTNSLGADIDDPEGDPATAPGVGISPLFGFAYTLFSTFEYTQGAIGIFGWLDTPAPTFVYFTWSLLAGGILLGAFVLARGRALLQVIVLTATVLLLPPLLQGLYITSGGVIWQGRYILPLFVCLLVATGAALADRLTLDRRQITVLVALTGGLWAFAQFQSFAAALRRYAVGLDGGWLELLDPAWSPPGGVWLPLIAFGLLVAAVPAGAVVVARRVRLAAVERD